MIKRRNNGLKNKNIQKNLEIVIKIKCHFENENLIREFSQTFYVLCPFRMQRSWLSTYLLSIYKPSLSMVFTVSLCPLLEKKKKNLFCYFSIKNILAAKNKRVIPKAIEMINFAMFKINVRHPPPKKNCYLLLYSCKASMMSQRDICSRKVSSTSTETWVFPLLRIQSVSKAKEGFKSLLNFSNLDFL